MSARRRTPVRTRCAGKSIQRRPSGCYRFSGRKIQQSLRAEVKPTPVEAELPDLILGLDAHAAPLWRGDRHVFVVRRRMEGCFLCIDV